jgi:hypothetical protein
MSAGNEDIIFGDTSMLQEQAQKMAEEANNRRKGVPAPQAPQHNSPPTSNLTPTPPSSKVMSERDMKAAKLMEEYNKEKRKLERIASQLTNLSHGDKCGDIIRNFGLSQVVIQVGNIIDRTNGLVLLRALKASSTNKTLEGKRDVTDGEYKKISTSQTVVTSLYEVWGLMEDGSIGLTASYAPNMVAFVVSLTSGLDQPPEAEEDDDDFYDD